MNIKMRTLKKMNNRKLIVKKSIIQIKKKTKKMNHNRLIINNLMEIINSEMMKKAKI